MSRIFALVIVVVLMFLVPLFFSDALTYADVRSITTFGFLLAAAYFIGESLSWFGFPKMTGYILAGIFFGPYLVGFVSAGTVRELKHIEGLALTFIALAAGGELRLEELRQRLKTITLTVAFTVIVFVGVGIFTLAAAPLLPFLDGGSTAQVLAVAALLGTLSMARSPSSLIAIIHECKARGPFTEMVLGVTVLVDVLVIILFAAVASFGQALVIPAGQMDFRLVGMVGIEVVGSILIGILLALLISLYIRYVRVGLLVFILGVAFLVTLCSKQLALLLDLYYSISLHLEPMLICVTTGFCVQNFSCGGRLFVEQLKKSSLPIYVIFFSLAGAALNIEALNETWRFAVLAVIVRFILIWLGAYLGGRLGGDPPRFRRMAGLAFITQAGVSLGLAGIVMNRFPDWGAALATTIVAIIALNQIIGPIAFKFALGAVGEARVQLGRRVRSARG